MPREEQPADNVNSSQSDMIGGMPLRAEDIGFAADEMARCPKCGRANSPERFECIYCGAVLGVGDKVLTIDRTPPESWENGFNLILLNAATTADESAINAAAKIAGLPQETVAVAVNAKRPLPLMRVKDPASAEALSEMLSECGFETKIVEDAELRLTENPRRVRGIEFGGGEISFVDFNTHQRTSVVAADIELIVTGKLFSTRVESTEKLSRKKEAKAVDRSELSADAGVIDIYVRGLDKTFRILSTGFDFSCLGETKAMFAAENMSRLTETLRSFAAAAKFVGDHDDVREILNAVWPVATRRDSKGMRRSIFKGSSVESVATSDNLEQFTRFSRLSRILL